MLSLEQIRNEPDAVRAALIRRAEDDDCLDEILALDSQRRVAITDGDHLRSRRNQVSREIGQARAQGQQPPADVVAEMRNVGQQISDLEETVRTLDVRVNGRLMELPNLPDATTLDGLDESANRVLRHWGELPQLDFAPQPHWDLAEQLGIIDFQRGVKLSGSRFYTDERSRRTPGAGHHIVDAGPAQRGARLHRAGAAHPGASGDYGRLRQPAPLRRQPVPRCRR